MSYRVIIPGGTGFLGQSLARVLHHAGYEVVVLTRGTAQTTPVARHVQWDAKTPGDWVQELNGAAAIVNYVGKSVDCRKTEENKRIILESRVDSVRAIGHACRQIPHPPPVWIQQSTAHIYGDTHDEILDESSPIGTGFAPDVGTAWEAALAESVLPAQRVVTLRTSFVLGRHGGALGTLARIARLGLGGTVGSGRQYISWIHEDDVNAVVLRAMTDASMRGIYVLTGPNPVTNAAFMRELRRALGRPWSPPAPGLMVRIASRFMNTDPELALLGRRCVPTRLLAEGFAFQHPDLPEALRDLLQ